MLLDIKQDLKKLADPKKAIILRRFFKTGKGEYAEGDDFIGIKVPEQRKIAKKYRDLDLSVLQKLLDSKIHEYRLTGLFILVDQYERVRKKENLEEMKGLVNFYLANLKNVNNWDLVDLSAPKILGDYFYYQRIKTPHTKQQVIDEDLLFNLAKSKNIFKRRIAVLSTFIFIKHEDYADSLVIARRLLRDDHDLIHKAVGWMLREIGKKDKKELVKFLNKYHKRMPRTMLRYAIERFDENERKKYMKKSNIKKLVPDSKRGSKIIRPGGQTSKA